MHGKVDAAAGMPIARAHRMVNVVSQKDDACNRCIVTDP